MPHTDQTLPRLSRALRPEAGPTDSPIGAVQFGTGAFLRGFVDAFLDEARAVGTFSGRVVAIGSTGSGRSQSLSEQDGLFTLLTRGVVDGQVVDERRVVSSVAGAVSSTAAWEDVLALAREPALELIFSNTTEVGIALDPDDRPYLHPPRSFPGKLTTFLSQRARVFSYAPERGVVVLPCELIEDNGDRLRDIVLELADWWRLPAEFAAWVRESVAFCNTLVDRIVTGRPTDAAEVEAEVGYADALLTECEPYRLFAIEASGAVRDRLAFARGLDGVTVTDDIAPYRERKVRTLNGAHTITVPLALLCGLETVAEAAAHPAVGLFLRHVMLDEIAPVLEVPDAPAYALEVLERFTNPYLRHALIDITLQSTTKMRVRVVPSILAYARRTGEAPASLAFGFAAWLLYMRTRVGATVSADDRADAVTSRWTALAEGRIADSAALVADVCADDALWGTDLTSVPGFASAVATHLEHMLDEGVEAALAAHLAAPAAST